MSLGLSLPVDIPWRRLCVSEDMIARMLDHSPLRWRSSLAVFDYEPGEEEQIYEGSRVSYLKVVCTLTGFQPDGDEVGVRDRRAYSAWHDPVVVENYAEMVSAYYGCYGALLEVTVVPQATPEQLRKLPPDQFPYFVDFEPKKRELYEIVSETGEMMSRSLESVNVRKGTTTTEGHERVDIFGGASIAGQGKSGAGGSAAVQGQWGTKDLNQEEYSNIRTTDQGREQRESFSHTTQLTQMYHQLNSYHLGTNRAVFYVLPRPHVVQAPNTFVNGPRQLEGMQEFFLVVMRPKAIKSICVLAHLETAHLAAEPEVEFETRTDSFNLRIFQRAKDTTGGFDDESSSIFKEDQATYTPPEGYEIDLERSGGYEKTVSGVGIVSHNVTPERDRLTLAGKVEARCIDRTFPQSNILIDGVLDLAVVIFLRKQSPTITGYRQSLWLTGRDVASCSDLLPALSSKQPDYVTYEQPLPISTPQPVGGEARVSIQTANAMRAEIGRGLRQSVNSPDRYARGTVRFTETAFLGRTLSRLIRRPGSADNDAVQTLPGVNPAILGKLNKVAQRISRGRLLAMSLAEQADQFGLTPEESVELRRALLGLTRPAPTGPDRWKRRPLKR